MAGNMRISVALMRSFRRQWAIQVVKSARDAGLDARGEFGSEAKLSAINIKVAMKAMRFYEFI